MYTIKHIKCSKFNNKLDKFLDLNLKNDLDNIFKYFFRYVNKYDLKMYIIMLDLEKDNEIHKYKLEKKYNITEKTFEYNVYEYQ